MNYRANFKDVDNNQLTLDIYKTLNDPFKEVTLTDSVIIESEDADELTNGGILTTSLKFSLLGKFDEDFISLATSQLTEYKVLIKKHNEVVYFGYLINGVYETDFSRYDNYIVQFGASDFKILEKTKSAASLLLNNAVNFVDIFRSTCLFNDFSSLINYNLTINRVSNESINKAKTTSTNVETLLTSVLLEKSMLYNEKNEPINEKQVLDEILKQYGFILRQYLGKMYIYEPSAANSFNEVYEGVLSNLSKTNLLNQSNSTISNWSNKTISEFYGNQSLNIDYKKDRLVLQFDKQYKDNYETAEFVVNTKNHKDVYLPANRIDGYIAPASDNPMINWYIYRVNNSVYNSSQFIDNSMCFIETDNVSVYPSKIKYMAGYGFWRPTTTGNKVTVKCNNTFAYNYSVASNIYIRLRFDTLFKLFHTDTLETKKFKGIIKIYVSDGDGNQVLLETKNYLCKKSDNSDFNKKEFESVDTFEENKKADNQYKKGYSDEFIFTPSNSSNYALSNLKIEFYQPSTTDRDQTTSFIDFWGVNNIKLDFVYLNSLGEYTSYEETDAEELVVETVNLPNNVSEEVKFKYAYLTNDEYYPLIKNSLYEYNSTNKISFLSNICIRSSKYVSSTQITLENIKISDLYKQLSKTRFDLNVDIKNNYDTKPNYIYLIPSIASKKFIMNYYSFDLRNNILSLNIKEFIQ